MYAMVNVQQYQIVATGTTVAECEKNYVALLASNNLSDGTISSANEVSGVIEDIRTAVIDGNTHVYIRLHGEDAYYVISVADSLIAAILSEGDEVKLAADDGDGELISAYSVEKIG